MKKLASLIFLLTLSVGIVAPKKADAMIGAAMSIAGLPLVPIVMGVGAVPFLTGSIMVLSGQDHVSSNISTIGGIIGLHGWVILDEEGTSFEYGELSNEVADKAGLTLEERKAFNRSVPEFNAVMEEVYHEVLAQYGQREDATVSEVINTSENLWQEYSSNFAPVEQSALKKYREFLGNLELSVQ